MALQLLIAGIDRTARVLFPTVRVTQNLTSQVDTLTCQLRLPEGADSEVPSGNQDILLLDGSEKLFGGKIVTPPRGLVGNTGEIQVNVQAQDYQVDMNRRLGVEGYQNQSAGAIVSDLISSYLTGFGITAGTIEDGPLLENYPVNYEGIGDAIARLAKLVGFDWYVDYDKHLHFYNPTGSFSEAPWNLVVDASPPYEASAPYEGFSFQEDITQLRNVVTVRGARTQSDLVTQSETTSGVERNWILNLGEVVPGSLTMTIDGVGQSVGEEGEDDPETVDWLVNYQNRSVKATDATTTPASGVVIEFTYRYYTQIIVSARDAASIARFASGSDTGEFEHVIVNPDITDRTLAITVAKAELKLYAQPAVTASYRTTRPGLRAGQRQRLTLPRLGVSGLFLIRSCTLSFPAYVNQAAAFQSPGYFRKWSVQLERIAE